MRTAPSYADSLRLQTRMVAIGHLREALTELRLGLAQARASGIRTMWLERQGIELQEALAQLAEQIKVTDEH